MQVGLAFLPANIIIMAVFSLGLSAKLVMRFGIRAPLSLGLLAAAVALVLFSRAPAGGNFVLDVLPGMVKPFAGLPAMRTNVRTLERAAPNSMPKLHC
jgi:hypothetical protein